MSEISQDRLDFELWRGGDEAGAKQLFDRYVDQVVQLARRHLSKKLGARFDPEDIAQSVFRTFFHRARKGQFEVKEPEDLCKLLARITVHKTFRKIAFHKRGKRNTDVETGETQEMLLNRLAEGPTPDEAVALCDYLEHFLSQLRPEDRRILEMRMEGYNNVEIAEQLGISDRKIRRLMERLRGLAEQMGMAP